MNRLETNARETNISHNYLIVYDSGVLFSCVQVRHCSLDFVKKRKPSTSLKHAETVCFYLCILNMNEIFRIYVEHLHFTLMGQERRDCRFYNIFTIYFK